MLWMGKNARAALMDYEGIMEETLLLPQWAQSKQEARAETLQKVGEGMQQFVSTMQAAFSAVGDSLRCFFNDIAQTIKPVVDALQKALSHVYTPKPKPKPRKRSSRRGQVQAKRKRLGLDTFGKYDPPTWLVNDYYEPANRKEHYAHAKLMQRPIKRAKDSLIEMYYYA